MFYDFSNKRKMECEKYQDCSWFQQDSPIEFLNKKLSLVETAEPIIDINDFDFAMQHAIELTTPKGDSYLEVFDDVFLQENEKIEEANKSNLMSSPHEESDNYDDNNLRDTNIDVMNPLYGLRKTDSYDNMDYISSTNPAEILPITLIECMNSGKSGLTALNIKTEIKKENFDWSPTELCSPDSSSHILQSDDSSLNIGREEVIEEENLNEVAEESCKSAKVVMETKELPDPFPLGKNINEQKINDDKLDVKQNGNENTIKREDAKNLDIASSGKLDFSLDLPKVNFEQSLGVNTPDLDFMDLVDFINEDIQMLSKSNNQETQTKNESSNSEVSSTENSTEVTDNGVKHVSSDQDKEKQESTVVNHSSALKSNVPRVRGLSANSIEMSDENTSIAERIKTKAKRRVTQKYTVIETNSSSEEDDDDYEEQEEEDDEDDDYDEEVPKKRCTVTNRRSRNSPDSTVNTRRPKESSDKVDSYRERRDKNNEASRRSRQNRKDRERHMFKTLEEEERRNVKLRAESDILEKQVTSLRKLLLQVVLRKADGT